MKGVGVLSVCEDRSHIAADKMIRKTSIPPPDEINCDCAFGKLFYGDKGNFVLK